ncbi:hypothetical protein E3N88_05215 [Mikania micrantha]|uniref:CRIB domain-containing protein n=1 Tax=Mikania micrantha TaxID=192012 RepID=A0A5N6PY45_9ASTR|nr:hypothetical protein E3N88_05215 [Mikania micrantha]
MHRPRVNLDSDGIGDWNHGMHANFVKEREMEIGYPTDVKHVAHIGWDGSSGSAPSWMNEFKTAPDFAATSIGNSGSAMSTWSSQEQQLDAKVHNFDVGLANVMILMPGGYTMPI